MGNVEKLKKEAAKVIEETPIPAIDFDQKLVMANGERMENVKRDKTGRLLVGVDGKPTGETETVDMREQMFGVAMRPRQGEAWLNKEIYAVNKLCKKIMDTPGPVVLTVKERNFLIERIETEDTQIMPPAFKAVYLEILDPSIGADGELPAPSVKKPRAARRDEPDA